MNTLHDISVKDVQACQDQYILVDVREPHELLGPEGFVKSSLLFPLGPSLIQFFEKADPSKAYVFICRSGVRSRKACEIAILYGFSCVYNMKGGMVAWQGNKKNLTQTRINGTNKVSSEIANE